MTDHGASTGPSPQSPPGEPSTASEPGDPDQDDLVQPQIAIGWRLILFCTWALAWLAIAAVWQTTVQLGHTTWWLGPAGEPNPLPIRVLPFYLPTLVLFSLWTGLRGVSWLMCGAALTQIVIGLFDLSVYRNLALVEIGIGVLCLAAAVASFAAPSGTPHPVDEPEPNPAG